MLYNCIRVDWTERAELLFQLYPPLTKYLEM